MTIELFQTPEYKKIMQEHILKNIEYLFQKNKEFAVACETEHISFNPELPQSIKDSFGAIVMFVLGGYTFESAEIDNDYLSFEAGFGEENFGSTLTVPLLCIKQVFVDDSPIMLNLAKYEIINKNSTPNKSSMEALLSNPENQKLIRRKKL